MYLTERPGCILRFDPTPKVIVNVHTRPNEKLTNDSRRDYLDIRGIAYAGKFLIENLGAIKASLYTVDVRR